MTDSDDAHESSDDGGDTTETVDDFLGGDARQGHDADHETASEDGADVVSDGDSDRSEPLSDIASRVAERRAQASVRDDSEDELFESMSVGDLDDEDVWTSLVDGDDDEEVAVGVGVGASAEPVDDHGDVSDPEHVIPKNEFCQRCEYFSDPPELACTHEGTTIVEMPDSDHFCVRNCPMVDDE
ncbi:hypothetical protein C455_12148 [Haloferax larsenii JCM 13917]|nr:hypothetical protein [Haloferax larsenii]ELZ78435.1 hypothetical protein C455_12148 [Haloferax larsenii JCM 13917]